MAKDASKEKENKLVTLLKNDDKLKADSDKKMEYIAMASIFMDNFSENMYKTSIDMNEVFPYYTIDDWKDFLNYPVVRKYVKSFKDEKITNIADQGLSEGSKDAIGIKKAIEASGPATNNSNIVLIRVPEKVEVWD